MGLRRLTLFGALASALTLSLLGLLFLGVELPTELRTPKFVTIQRPKSVPGPAQPGGDDENVYIVPGAEFSTIPLTPSLQTTVPNGATIHGFSVLDNLVMHNGTFYIVTRNRSAFLKQKGDFIWKPFKSGSGEVEKDPDPEV